jgi:UDP-N-acetylglucosamine 2-epimerase (non-hydrolysing)
MLSQFGILPAGDGTFHVLDPVGYHDSICLTKNARFVLTDSGGLQEESTYLRTPCLTLRPNTERPVTITHGSNRLTDVSRLSSDIEAVLNSPITAGQVPLFWDGKAAERVVDAIIEHDQTLRRTRLP